MSTNAATIISNEVEILSRQGQILLTLERTAAADRVQDIRLLSITVMGLLAIIVILVVHSRAVAKLRREMAEHRGA